MPNKADFSRSWDKSRDEILRLIGYLAAQKSHSTRNTVSLNGARQIISELIKPMAEVSQTIHINIMVSEDEALELKNTELVGENLRKMLGFKSSSFAPYH